MQSKSKFNWQLKLYTIIMYNTMFLFLCTLWYGTIGIHHLTTWLSRSALLNTTCDFLYSTDEWVQVLYQFLSFFFFLTLSFVFFFQFFISYFLNLHFKCYPKSPLYPPLTLLPYPPTPTSWSWRSPVLGHIKFARLRGFSSQWWLTGPCSATYAARDTSSGGTG